MVQQASLLALQPEHVAKSSFKETHLKPLASIALGEWVRAVFLPLNPEAYQVSYFLFSGALYKMQQFIFTAQGKDVIICL